MDFVPGISADVWLNRVNLASHLFHINQLLVAKWCEGGAHQQESHPQVKARQVCHREPKTGFQTFNNKNAKSLKTKPECQN